ncbi:MAG: YkvA family protein [Candidatus Dormibacteraceae bacterium]
MVLEVPNQGKLAYSLLRDSRVPLPPKLGLIGALGLIVSPLDLPAWIPLVGELDMLALGLLAVKIFIRACPKELVEEHRIALARKEGLFHDDLQAACSGISQRGKNWLGRILPLGGKSRG